jgi:hypothetical protein
MTLQVVQIHSQDYLLIRFFFIYSFWKYMNNESHKVQKRRIGYELYKNSAIEEYSIF